MKLPQNLNDFLFDEFCSQNFHTAVGELINTKPETFTQKVHVTASS